MSLPPACKCINEDGTKRDAIRRQVQKAESPKQGQWFWTCSQPQGDQCKFFAWETSSKQRDNSPSGVVGQGYPGIPKPLPSQPSTNAPSSPPARSSTPHPSNSNWTASGIIEQVGSKRKIICRIITISEFVDL